VDQTGRGGHPPGLQSQDLEHHPDVSSRCGSAFQLPPGWQLTPKPMPPVNEAIPQAISSDVAAPGDGGGQLEQGRDERDREEQREFPDDDGPAAASAGHDGWVC
jgi:hypothetical protein